MTNKVLSAPVGSSTVSVLVGGLTAGLLDIVYAFVSAATRERSPEFVLQFVASGLLGRESFNGGVSTALIGLTLHFLMALLMATIFVGATRAGLHSLRQYPLLAGPLYGVGIYFVMQQVVLPLSRAPLSDPRPPINFPDLAGHMFLVGLPIALAAHRWGITFTERREAVGGADDNRVIARIGGVLRRKV